MQAVRFGILLSLFLTANAFAAFTIYPQPKSKEQIVLFGEQYQWVWENTNDQEIILAFRLYDQDNKVVDQFDERVDPTRKSGQFVFGVLRQNNKVLTRVFSCSTPGGQRKIETESDEPASHWRVKDYSEKPKVELGKSILLAESFIYEEVKAPLRTATTISQPSLLPGATKFSRQKLFQRLELTVKKVPTQKEIEQRKAEVIQLLKTLKVRKRIFNGEDSQSIVQYLVFEVPKMTNNEGLISGVGGICGASPYRLGKVDISFDDESLYDALNLFAEKAGSSWELSIYNDLSDVSISFNASTNK
jgi:hypothetical protein